MSTDTNIKTILVHVTFFASLSDFMGTDKLELKVNHESTIEDLKDLIFKDKKWNKPLLFAINHNFANLNSQVQDNDEVVFMPFVSGG